MKITICLCFSLLSFTMFAQETLETDVNADGKPDKVWFKDGLIYCELSGINPKILHSRSIEDFAESADFVAFSEATNGFHLNVNYMRSGFSVQFRYNKKKDVIETIGMSRYEFGPASNDGSGESSLNLLTNDYLGNWNYYDMKTEELKPIPEIKAKMKLKQQTLTEFDTKIIETYISKCVALYYKAKKGI